MAIYQKERIENLQSMSWRLFYTSIYIFCFPCNVKKTHWITYYIELAYV